MIKVNNVYKAAMNEKFRGRSHMMVTIGAINQTAQEFAKADTSSNKVYYFSNTSKPFQGFTVKPDDRYATLEQNFFRVDDQHPMSFPPRSNNQNYFVNNGLVASSDTISIKFDKKYDIRGLTLVFCEDFEECYPIEFTISNGIVTFRYSNEAGSFVSEDIFENTDHLTIKAIAMKHEHQRLRIGMINMGVGITFDSTKLINVTDRQSVSLITEEIPSIDFSATIENYDRLFDVENKESVIYYLENGQEVSWKYGLETDPKNPADIYWLQGGKAKLMSWSADDTALNITAQDYLTEHDDIYYGGKYYPSGISLYELAEDVFIDMGYSTHDDKGNIIPDYRKIKIDEYLKDVIVFNPMPVVNHKEALQIIANAGRCKLYFDKDGYICIMSNFNTVLDLERMHVITTTAAEWSEKNADSLLDATVDAEYATFSRNHFRADGTLNFIPRGKNYKNNGFVSDNVADKNGDYVGYNLIPFPYYNGASLDDRGVHYAVNNDGSVTAIPINSNKSNTSTLNSNILEPGEEDDDEPVGTISEYVIAKGLVLPKGEYYCKGDYFNSELSGLFVVIGYKYMPVGTGLKFTLTKEEKVDIRIRIAYGPRDYEIHYPMLVKVDSDGNYPTEYQKYEINKPYFDIKMEAVTTTYGIYISFPSVPPQAMTISGYNGNTKVFSYKKTDLKIGTNYFEESLENFNRLKIEFDKGYPYSRIFVDRVKFGDITDFNMTYELMTDYPKGNQDTKISDLYITKNNYGNLLETTPTNIITENVDLTPYNDYTFFLGEPCYGLNVTANGNALTILSQSSHYITVDTSKLTGFNELQVNGFKYNIIRKILVSDLNTSGTGTEWNNPLIDDKAYLRTSEANFNLAQLLLEWIGNYLANNITYDIAYRGEPCIETSDIVFLENKYVDKLQIQISEHQLDYNGGALHGTIKARRAVSSVKKG